MLPCIASARAIEPDPLLATLQAVGPQGKGQREAARAWAELVQAEASTLPKLLAALDQAQPLAANWIATAIEAIVQRETQHGGSLPVAELECFVRDVHHAPRARRLAYELLLSVDASARQRLVPGMINDPSLELRRDAVAMLMDEGQTQEKTDPARAKAIYQEAFAAARDTDQIHPLAERLRRLGEKVDLPAHFGLITHWQIIGPFDNKGEKGYDTVYPPEREISLTATYPGKLGPVTWKDWTTQDASGLVDLNKALEELKGVVAYGTSEFISPQRQEVQFRLASFSAVKIWLNGKLVDEHKVYHGGSQFDQYISRAVLEPGKNRILLKICQNEQTQPWTRVWQFQFRVCDELGTAILSLDRKQP
jgi:hypothetical protein